MSPPAPWNEATTEPTAPAPQDPLVPEPEADPAAPAKRTDPTANDAEHPRQEPPTPNGESHAALPTNPPDLTAIDAEHPRQERPAPDDEPRTIDPTAAPDDASHTAGPTNPPALAAIDAEHPRQEPPAPDDKPHTIDPTAANDENPPQGPPAPDNESRTGGAGGNRSADGEAEAVGPPPPEGQPQGHAKAAAPRPPQGTARAGRTVGLLLGLAAGDAAGWPAARHRAARMPEWTRRLTRELDTFAEQNATTTLPVPIALNQPPEPLRLGPSDDAEWAVFSAEALLRAGDDTALADLSRQRRTRAAIDLTWNALAGEVAAAADRAPEIESAVLPLRARISVRAGLGNLATGLRPPATGHDNPHYFDDAACVRACVLAVAHPGAPRLAADLAEFDARYTQDGDGVHGARAMAAALALALAGADVETCVNAALTELPETTEIGRNARHALKLAADAETAFTLIPLLEHQIVDHVYSYGIAAAETVPVALALTAASNGRIAEAVPAAACLSRVADSAPALAGALTGALGGGASIPATWREACRTLSGCALPRLTGTDLVELAELLEAAQPAPPGG